MKPGRELDALIAEKVMGFSLQYIDANNDGIHIWVSHSNGQYFTTPPYSTSIEAAWQIVEKLFEQRLYLQILPNQFGYKVDCNVVPGLKIEVGGRTAPHAICLAALKMLELKEG